jgi:hypothetical protein
MSRFSDALDVFKAVELRRWILPDQLNRVGTGHPKVVK